LPRLVRSDRLDLNSEGLFAADQLTARWPARLELPGEPAGVRLLPGGGVHGAVEPDRLAALATRHQDRRHRLRADPRPARPPTRDRNAWVTLSLQEGKNREVRRVLGASWLSRHPGLIRLAYGPFQLGHLARGAIEEVPRKVLQEQLGKGGEAQRRPPGPSPSRRLRDGSLPLPAEAGRG